MHVMSISNHFIYLMCLEQKQSNLTIRTQSKHHPLNTQFEQFESNFLI